MVERVANIKWPFDCILVLLCSIVLPPILNQVNDQYRMIQACQDIDSRALIQCSISTLPVCQNIRYLIIITYT